MILGSYYNEEDQGEDPQDDAIGQHNENALSYPNVKTKLGQEFRVLILEFILHECLIDKSDGRKILCPANEGP